MISKNTAATETATTKLVSPRLPLLPKFIGWGHPALER
jgi:hypothetical protein